jgi:hypothetical protein
LPDSQSATKKQIGYINDLRHDLGCSILSHQQAAALDQESASELINKLKSRKSAHKGQKKKFAKKKRPKVDVMDKRLPGHYGARTGG